MRDTELQITSGKPEIGPVIVFSALLSLLVMIVVLLDYTEHPRELGKSWSDEKGTSVLQVGYAVALAASAFAGALVKKKWIGCVHAALMSGVSVYCIVSGLSTLNDKSIIGGRGPDANPVAGVVYGAALGVVVFGVLCGCFAVAVWLKVHRRSSSKSIA
jgi:hypothetical protein